MASSGLIGISKPVVTLREGSTRLPSRIPLPQARRYQPSRHRITVPGHRMVEALSPHLLLSVAQARRPASRRVKTQWTQSCIPAFWS